jgi:class 3 adenylate cyclase
VSERRVTSLLFADLVGFTPLAEARDAEAVRELLSAYFERARAVVERYGGTVEKFIGDAVCAVWGVPTAKEDDAERAVRAGLDLISAVSALGDELRIEGLEMRVGITTGAVAVTLGAVGEGMVAGDAVNTAARVQATAGPGEVWVDDTTRSLTTASLAYESAGTHELKGKAVPLELFRAVRTTAAVGGSQRVDGLEAPFVGRDRELRLVKELFHATADERRARLVLVVGDPGIGKSRLSWEFEKYLDAITTQSTWWLRGRCLSYGQGVAGRVVAEMVRSLLRVSDEDDPAVLAALDARLETHVSDPAERAVLRPRLLSLLGLSDAVFEQSDLFACWRGFLEALTSDGSSVTVLVEDLQWADDGFLDFLEHLLDAGRAPVLVLALARPEISARRPGIGTGRRSTTVFLDPLPDAAMCRLLDGLVTDLPAALRDELVRRADGVPLYAVETVRSLIDRDVVVPAGGRYVVDQQALAGLRLQDLAPPASLHALLAARLDALTPEERRVVQDGSVLGLSFTREGLEALTPAGVDLDRALDGLRRKEIVNVDTDPRSPERGSLRFVQALLRGVAYETLSRRDRKARHIAVAEHLLRQPEAEAISGVTATHWLDAAGAVPDDEDVSVLRGRAAAALEQAAAHAAAVGAPLDALAHHAQLLSLEPSDEVVLRTCARSTELVQRVGRRFDEGLAHVELGLAAAERLGSLDGEAALLLRLRRSALRIALGERAPSVVDDARAVFDATGGREDRISVRMLAARTVCLFTQFTGDVDTARDVTIAALDDVERYGDDTDFLYFLDTMSTWFGIAGYRRLSAVVRRASTRALDVRRPTAGPAFANLAVSLLHDDVDAAAEAAGKGVESGRLLGEQNVAAETHLLLAATAAGDWDLARRLACGREESTELLDWETYASAATAVLAWCADDPTLLRPVPLDQADDALVLAWREMHAAVAASFDDRPADAVRAAVRSTELMASLGLAHEDLPLAVVLAVDLCVALGAVDELRRLADVLRQLPSGQRFRLLDAQILRADAHLSDDRAAGLQSAADVLDAMGGRYWAAATRVELAAAHAEAGESERAAAVLAEVEPFLRGIGAARALAVVDRMRAAVDAPVG